MTLALVGVIAIVAIAAMAWIFWLRDSKPTPRPPLAQAAAPRRQPPRPALRQRWR